MEKDEIRHLAEVVAAVYTKKELRDAPTVSRCTTLDEIIHRAAFMLPPHGPPERFDSWWVVNRVDMYVTRILEKRNGEDGKGPVS